ncbi:MAG: hypothetical protein AAF899_17520 [Pseudomonadota bacterium]
MPAEARALIDHPSDRPLSDDVSPHGNDAGADILGQWCRSSRDRVRRAALGRTNDDRPLTPDGDPQDCLQVALPMAFAHLKKSSAVPDHVVAAPRAATARALEDPDKHVLSDVAWN